MHHSSRMKVFAAFLVIVALCAVQLVSGAGVLDTLIAGITRQKIQVKSRINRLERHSKDLSFNLGNKLHNLKTNSMQQINTNVNPTLKSIEDATKESTANGKDASQCYESARISLREYSMTGFADLENCRTKALGTVSPSLNNVDSTITIGQQVISYYDSIVPSCFSSNTMQMQSCIAGKMATGAQQVKTFETTADNVIQSSNSAASSAQITAMSCNNGVVNIVIRGTGDVKVDANKCIAALQ